MTAPLVLHSRSADATRAVAAAVAGRCVPGDVLLLSGDLGAGKTTFAQGFGRALGVEEQVTSPTFTLVRQYDVPPGPSGIRTLLHADVYRLEHLAEIADLGLGQLVEDGGVALVEWGEAAAPVLGDDALTVSLSVDPHDDDGREIEVRAVGPSWSSRWSDLCDGLVVWVVPR